jgi:hypothetical protein
MEPVCDRVSALLELEAITFPNLLLCDTSPLAASQQITSEGSRKSAHIIELVRIA